MFNFRTMPKYGPLSNRYIFWLAASGLAFLLSVCAFVLPRLTGNYTSSGQFGDTFGFASAVINGLGFLAVVYELSYSSWRQRAQATIQAFTEANPVVTLGELRIQKLSQKGPLDKARIESLSQNEDDYRDLWDALDSLQFLAVGLKTGVYDVDVASHLYGSWFSYVVTEFQPLIDHAQASKPNHRQFFYRDAVEMAEKLLEKHNERLLKADNICR